MGIKGYFSIWGCYQGLWEKLDDCKSSDEAIRLANEYSLAFGRDWVIAIRHKGKVWGC